MQRIVNLKGVHPSLYKMLAERKVCFLLDMVRYLEGKTYIIERIIVYKCKYILLEDETETCQN